MLSIGDFSTVCKVSTKTLRYYAEIGLIFPTEVDPENGYRYYAIEQLETMLLINRLKSYHFSLEEIKKILESTEALEEQLYAELIKKKNVLKQTADELKTKIKQMDEDMNLLQQGKSIMAYYEAIDVQYTEVPTMFLLSTRKRVHETEFKEQYQLCFDELLGRIATQNLTIAGSPMVLFHDNEFRSFGLDTEFAFPVNEQLSETSIFEPGLCLKTVVKGPYSELSSVYARQIEWAETEGYESSNALFELYITDPAKVSCDDELITEIYYPIRKRRIKK